MKWLLLLHNIPLADAAAAAAAAAAAREGKIEVMLLQLSWVGRSLRFALMETPGYC